jgi:hypothetical protein
MNNPMSLSDPNGLDCEDTDSVSVGDCDPGNGYDSSGNSYDSYEGFSDVYAATTTTMTQVPCLSGSAGPCYAMTVAQPYFDCSLNLICNSSYQSAASSLNPSSPSLYPVGPATPDKGVSVFSPHHSAYRSEQCRNGVVATAIGVGTTIGAGIAIAYLWPDIAAGALAEGGLEGGVALAHGGEAMLTIAAAPLGVVAAGTSLMIENCGSH